ncbi:MAG TPA: OprD family porin [Pseudomonas xinjiangensis]|uniref:OprD family porin n=2 Tax=root TaxID=1 RepID=A0A7V1BQ65_9GAMM|nr:OprD family porin [Halopseudomonas xinjiangensis]HEC48835.1 OprD family porin [Halopseudomonas xinjiangensis]
MKHVTLNALAAAVALSLTIPTSSALASSLTDDATASLQLRNFYFNRDFRAPGAQSKAEEWAQGFVFRGKTGYTHGDQGLGLDVHAAMGLKLDSADDRAGTGLLPNAFGDEGPGSYSHILFTAKAKVSNSELKVGGLIPALPIAQASDIRLLPQTYTGGALAIGEVEGLDIQAGQLRQVSYYNSSNLEDIGATVGGTSDRFNYLGGAYKFNADNTVLGLWRAELDDVYAQNLVNVIHTQPVGDWKLGANLAYFDTSDHGNQSLEIDHQLKSALLSAGTGAHTFRVGYQYSDGDTAFPYLTQNNPYIANYIQILDFARAGEKSWQLRYDIDFASLGIPGLKAFTRYVKGDNIDLGAAGTGEEWERDIDIIYTVQNGPLKNVSMQWRNAMVRSDVIRDIDENRLILAYTIPLM